MVWNRFRRLERVFDEHGVKPLIGVIPDNQDPQLQQFPECSGDFWAEMRTLQTRGWEIAQHGYQHVYVTRERGLMGVNGLSEFAGLPYAEQLDKVARGQMLLRKYGLRFETFMAPSHSFDTTTLRVLKDLGFTTVTDGCTPFPYIEQGLIFLPQLLATPRVLPFGVQTFCLHLNIMTDLQIHQVEAFIGQHYREFLTFAEARALATPRPLNRIAGRVMGVTLRSLRVWLHGRRLKVA
jgi:peptidoglycan/xylan/chitin deacetylase (PgdA/CDA1 family)